MDGIFFRWLYEILSSPGAELDDLFLIANSLDSFLSFQGMA